MYFRFLLSIFVFVVVEQVFTQDNEVYFRYVTGEQEADTRSKGGYGAILWLYKGKELLKFGGESRISSGYDNTGIYGGISSYHLDTGEWEELTEDLMNEDGVFVNKGSYDLGRPACLYGGCGGELQSGDGAEFWFFGGTDSGLSFAYDDLWIYNREKNQWKWLAGGAQRNLCGTCLDKGQSTGNAKPSGRLTHACVNSRDILNEIVVFGGYGASCSCTDLGYLNDLWVFNFESGYWTWHSGSTLPDQLGIYGAKGEFNSTAAPGGREGPIIWSISASEMMLFGGYGIADETVDWPRGTQNDLWLFDYTRGAWKWVSGSQYQDQDGVFGTKNVYSEQNFPTATMAATSFGVEGNEITFGFGSKNRGMIGTRTNLMWRYNYVQNKWKYIFGEPSYQSDTAIFGELYEFHTSYRPGARYYASGVKRNMDEYFVYGGWGFDDSSSDGYIADIWYFGHAPTCDEVDYSSSSVCSGSGKCLYTDLCLCDEEIVHYYGFDENCKTGGRGTMAKCALLMVIVLAIILN